MVKKVRRYILFFITGLIHSLFVKNVSAAPYIFKCSVGQSAKECCEDVAARTGESEIRWHEKGGYCSARQYM